MYLVEVLYREKVTERQAKAFLSDLVKLTQKHGWVIQGGETGTGPLPQDPILIEKGILTLALEALTEEPNDGRFLAGQEQRRADARRRLKRLLHNWQAEAVDVT